MKRRLLTILFWVLTTIAYGCPPRTVPWPDGTCQPISEAVTEATSFLMDNMPGFDKANKETLFEGGIVVPTVQLSLNARQRFAWAASVPKDIFLDAVLPYASANEARTNWRSLLWEKLSPIINGSGNKTLEDVAYFVNANMWKWLAPSGTDSIVFKSNQTPLIYDPMSTMLFGYASCTGVSILYIDALRTLGIPARMVGTPAWNGDISHGNHNWVEVWLGEDGWHFIESEPAGPSETFHNPCDKWFCTKDRFGWTGTKVFAAEFSQSNDTHYPMAWDLDNTDIPGIDRTDYYERECNACSLDHVLIDIV